MSPDHATLGEDGKIPLDQLPAGLPSAVSWGDITGTLPDQTDLNTALGDKVDTADSRLSDARPPTTHDHPENILHSLATAVSDFLVASGAGAFVKKTLAEVKTILGLGSAAYTAATDYLGLHAKADTAGAADTATALATGADRTKLDGITAGAQVNSDITKAEIEAKLTGQIASHTHAGGGGGQPIGFVILGNDTLPQALATNINTRITVTAARTLTTTVPAAGTRCSVMVLTSGTTSYTITFGSGFKPVGTLATGTTTNRVFVVNFISNGTNLYETGRTASMAA